jgi:hypothetical protein
MLQTPGADLVKENTIVFEFKLDQNIRRIEIIDYDRLRKLLKFALNMKRT